MTNGEKLQSIFPNIIKYGNILIDDTGALQKNILFDDTWWNAEYKEPTTKNNLEVEKIIDEIEKEFEKVDIPIMDKLTLFAKVQNALYKCAVSNSENPNNSTTKNDLAHNLCDSCI